MAKYLIHASPKRIWYVTDYLIPSMIAQGIDRSDILILNDATGIGCLMKTMTCFAETERNDSGVWHLQDDVLISRDFKERTEAYNFGVVCGYCYDTEDDRIGRSGYVRMEDMWFSFPCIRIPNSLARDVGEWFFKTVLPENLFTMHVSSGKHDDVLFYKYVKGFMADQISLNLSPTLVAHVDYLIGGSTINPGRKSEKVGKNLYFKDTDLIEDLSNRLAFDERSKGNNGDK